jgi:hypothetical protein
MGISVPAKPGDIIDPKGEFLLVSSFVVEGILAPVDFVRLACSLYLPITHLHSTLRLQEKLTT